MRFLPLSLLLALAPAACLSTGSGDVSRAEAFAAELAADPRVGEEVDRICFTGNIDSFSETTDRSVVVSVSPTRDFLITTRSACFDLEYAQSITFDDFGTCLTRGDRLFAFDSVFGPGHLDRSNIGCLIDRFYVWDKDAAEVPDDAESGDPADTDAEAGPAS